MLGFRAKLIGRDISKELQFEDSSDIIVAQILAQKDAKSFEPPYGYENLRFIFEKYQSEPYKLHKAFCEYRFVKIAELESGSFFSIERILGYMMRLLIVEQWIELDAQEGKKMIEMIGTA